MWAVVEMGYAHVETVCIDTAFDHELALRHESTFKR